MCYILEINNKNCKYIYVCIQIHDFRKGYAIMWP